MFRSEANTEHCMESLDQVPVRFPPGSFHICYMTGRVSMVLGWLPERMALLLHKGKLEELCAEDMRWGWSLLEWESRNAR